MSDKTKTTIKLSDERKAWAWAWNNDRDQTTILIMSRALELVDAGATKIDGFNITQEKVL